LRKWKAGRVVAESGINYHDRTPASAESYMHTRYHTDIHTRYHTDIHTRYHTDTHTRYYTDTHARYHTDIQAST
jgi:hypothetical protein